MADKPPPPIPDPTATFDGASRRGELAYPNLDQAFEARTETPPPVRRSEAPREWDGDSGSWRPSLPPMAIDPTEVVLPEEPLEAPEAFDFPSELSGDLPGSQSSPSGFARWFGWLFRK